MLLYLCHSFFSFEVGESLSLLFIHKQNMKTLVGNSTQVHMKVDKMGAKVSSGHVKPKVAISECMVAVIKAMAVLEGDYELPQAGDHLPAKIKVNFQFMGCHAGKVAGCRTYGFCKTVT